MNEMSQLRKDRIELERLRRLVEGIKAHSAEARRIVAFVEKRIDAADQPPVFF